MSALGKFGADSAMRYAPDAIRAFVTQVLDHLLEPDGMTVVHAGHFMLLPAAGGCAPSVNTTTEQPLPLVEGSLEPPDHILEALSIFASSTWHLGVALAAELAARSRMVRLITLVNDWQFLRAASIPDAPAIRSQFYSSHTRPFPSYADRLNAFGLDDAAVLALPGWYPFISESWLRRRLERRLKRQFRSVSDRTHLSVQDIGDSPRAMIFDDLGRACRLLVCGQADCAGEVMELVYLLQAFGCRQLVNIVPAECEKPVNEGSRRAIALFQLREFVALNISIPCLATALDDRPRDHSVRISRVYADQEQAECRLTAVVEPVRWK